MVFPRRVLIRLARNSTHTRSRSQRAESQQQPMVGSRETLPLSCQMQASTSSSICLGLSSSLRRTWARFEPRSPCSGSPAFVVALAIVKEGEPANHSQIRLALAGQPEPESVDAVPMLRAVNPFHVESIFGDQLRLQSVEAVRKMIHHISHYWLLAYFTCVILPCKPGKS